MTRRPTHRKHEQAFTLIEILIVLAIISLLMGLLGATIVKMGTKAREAQTVATLRKIDGLLIERMQGLERIYGGRDFQKYVEKIQDKLTKGDPANGVPQLFGISSSAIEAAAKKDFFREFFPQRLSEMMDAKNSSNQLVADGIPDKLQFDEVYQAKLKWVIAPSGPLAGKLVPYGDQNGNNTFDTGEPFHDQVTESAELLYFALTRMEIFGVPATGADAFLTQEVADTDQDGLPEFVDGWGKPLRFYRWPTRLFKPFGLTGLDQGAGVAGVDDDGNGATDTITMNLPGFGNVTTVDPLEVGYQIPGSLTQSTDDLVIWPQARQFASLYFKGLPRAPITVGAVMVLGDYDLLNEDPDDSYGALIAEVKRLTATGIPIFASVSESRYHTLDTFHKPLVVSAGVDGYLGLYEPYHSEDLNLNGILDTGEDANGNGMLDLGILAQPVNEDINNNNILDTGEDQNGNLYLDTITVPVAALDDLTNRNRRAGD